ncbi:MAG: proprotein convertase P-domain-containing protein [Acidobacteriota bacterium]
MANLLRRIALRSSVILAVVLLALIAAPGPAGAQEKPSGAVVEADQGLDLLAAAAADANDLAHGADVVIAGDTVTVSSPILIPATGTSGVANPFPAQVTVSGLPTTIGRLQVRLNGLTHTYPADLHILLVGPGGQKVSLMAANGGGTDVERAFLTFDDLGAVLPAILTTGTYAPKAVSATSLSAPAPPGPYSTGLSAFIGTNPNGVWSLFIDDRVGGDSGRLSGFSLIITPQSSNTTITPIPDLSTVNSTLNVTGATRPIAKVSVSFYMTHTFDADLDVFLIGPDGTAVELTTDNGSSGDNYGTSCAVGSRTVFEDGAPTSITAGVAPFVGTFSPEQPLAAFAGKAANGTWTLRVTDDLGGDVGAIQCWHLALIPTEPVQPPTDMTIANMTGNTVTFKWTPSPAGDAATSYVFEGGVTPGQVLASVPTTVENLTLNVPNGAYFVRVKAVSGGVTSSASNELPIYVGVPVPPSAPSNLLLTRNNSNLELTWRNTFAGAQPTSLFLDVTGAITTTLPLPVVESFTYSGVPDGAYTFAVRAANGAGVSAPSNSRNATFGAAAGCSGAPNVPANFRAFKSGQTITVDWDSPGIGSAVSFYVLSVTGGVAAVIPTTARSISGNVPSGSYNLSLTAVNQCGTSTATPTLAVTIP